MEIRDVVIIGAGPYGLSIAAHLGGLGVDYRIFGSPMQTWTQSMPRGMHLKSEGFASSLFDPGNTFTLGHFCKERGLPYADKGRPVPLETFSAYGLEFQNRFVPGLEDKRVTEIRRASRGFKIRLADGEIFQARRVVIAAGLTHFDFLPPVFEGLTEEHVTHSSRHSQLDQFRGCEVAVIGGGSSAIDVAALLHQAGAKVQVIARKAIRFHDPPNASRSLFDRLMYPMSGIGLGWKLAFCCEAPWAFHLLPEHIRLRLVRKLLGPAPGWFVKDKVIGKVDILTGWSVAGAAVQDRHVQLRLTDESGSERVVSADHVIAGTGYRVNLRRFTFLDSALQAGIHSVEQTPVLSPNFESSVRGLYFVGAAAANSFGPLLRFAVGAGFTARRISRALARSASPRVVYPQSLPTQAESEHSEAYR